MPRNRGEIVVYKNFTHNIISGRVKSMLWNILLCDTGEVPGQDRSAQAQLLTLQHSQATVIPRLRNSIAVRCVVYKYIFLSMLQISG